MKSITVRQPWASLIAARVKTIETRSRSTHYRGRIAIHAGLHRPVEGEDVGDTGWYWEWDVDHGQITNWLVKGGGFDVYPAPLGAVVASAVLIDCVPTDELRWTEIWAGWAWQGANGDPIRANPARDPYPVVANVDQRPFGDFSPGRWALLLDDIAPTTERCPTCWGGTERVADFVTVDPHGCPICNGTTRCDPIPARGQLVVPWEWTP